MMAFTNSGGIMKKSRRIKGLKRAILLATLMVGVAGGGAYAVLQSQLNTLTGNTISTATANLQLSTDNVNFSNSHLGFDFNNIVPGGQAVPLTGYPFYLKNAGGTPLAIKLAVNSIPTNIGNVDISKVNIILTTVGSGASPQTFTLQSLLSSSSTGGVTVSTSNLDIGNTQLYKLQASMAADAISGSSASLGNIDFSFTGIAQ